MPHLGMAGSYDEPDDQDDRRDLLELMQAPNVADLLSDEDLNEIGQKVRRGYQRDKQSREAEGWDRKQKTAMDLARQVTEAKSFPWPGAANVKYPLLTVAAIQFAARSYPALVQGRDVVKAKVIGDDPDGKKRNRADRISRHMSWQVTEQMDEWEDEFDRLLHVLPIVGCAFKKVRWVNRLARPISELIPAEALVVNYWAKSLMETPRATHEYKLYPYRIAERMRSGDWREVELGQPQDSDGDDQKEHLFLEQHCWIDLDGDGYEEPWIVTVHDETSKVMSIIARFDEEGILIDGQGEIGRIEPVQYFVKYGFIPSPDGSFYDLGFGHLLNPLNEAINTTINQLLDAGTLGNAGGGWIGRGAKMKSGVHRFKPSEWKTVDSTGGNLKDQIVPLPVPQPSSVLFTLLGLLIDAGKDIAAIKDVLLGEQKGQQTATTTLALIEQGMKVFGALYKRLHRSAGREFKLIFRLNRLYLDPQQYFTVLDTPEAIQKEDYDDKNFDVVPVSDPSMVSDMQRLAKAEFLMQFMADPLMNGVEIRTRILEAAQIDGIDRLVVQKPPENPDALASAHKEAIEQMDAERKDRETDLKQRDADRADRKAELEGIKLIADTIKAIAEAEAVEPGQQIDLYKAQVADLKSQVQMISADQKAKQNDPGNRGRVSGVAGAPGDGGVPALPQGPPAGPGGGLGVGPGNAPVGPGVGAGVGPGVGNNPQGDGGIL